jgi:hypothetical protein
MKRWWATLATTAAFTAAWGVATSGQQPRSDGVTLTLSDRVRHSDGSLHFGVAGRPVAGLYPGATRRLVVEADNPFGYPIALRTLDGRVTWASRRGCPAGPAGLSVTTDGRLFPVRLAPHSHATLRNAVAVTMPKDATPLCSSTYFVIHLDAVASRTGR